MNRFDRLTVKRVLEVVALYPKRDELHQEYPELETEDIRQVLDFAAAQSRRSHDRACGGMIGFEQLQGLADMTHLRQAVAVSLFKDHLMKVVGSGSAGLSLG